MRWPLFHLCVLLTLFFVKCAKGIGKGEEVVERDLSVVVEVEDRVPIWVEGR